LYVYPIRTEVFEAGPIYNTIYLTLTCSCLNTSDWRKNAEFTCNWNVNISCCYSRHSKKSLIADGPHWTPCSRRLTQKTPLYCNNSTH